MKPVYLGQQAIQNATSSVTGGFLQMEGESWYKIGNYNRMQPFFISLASDSNHWMYISSLGGLTAGRISADNALFPYYTDDKIHENSESTGSKTLIRVEKEGKLYLWEPFTSKYDGIYKIERNIYKATAGNKLIFEEINSDLGISFRYAWMNSDNWGWIKKSRLTNLSAQTLSVEFIDGLQNILPSGVTELTQSKFSTLVDAYKRTELVSEVGLALFRMQAIMVDRAEPAESLKVSTIWGYGLEKPVYLLTSNQFNAFRSGASVTTEPETKGVRSGYFMSTQLSLAANGNKEWYFAAEVNQDSVKVNNLIDFLKKEKNSLAQLIEKDIVRGTEAFKLMVAQADGNQLTADQANVARHFSNVLFNVMRGGIYDKNYLIGRDNFEAHIKHFNKQLWKKHQSFLTSLPVELTFFELSGKVEKLADNQLTRLFYEYLPLTFSRRHGDPSRPWNAFNINIKDKDGKKLLAYQGNWRDIFQNWEALSLSYPGFIKGIITKFLDATTADGYNPYRVTNKGIDWEVIEPDNPWSNIGYWGDHQIIYLLKLLELAQEHYPGLIDSWLDKHLFAYANVPYRIKNYAAILADPKNTITFDDHLHEHIHKIEPEFGADARLILDAQGQVKLVNFTEKLLVTFLAKTTNFIPGGGIWMNTLRPEWNDANNALVGNGVSMVTLYYMRRFAQFALSMYETTQTRSFAVSSEVAALLEQVSKLVSREAGKTFKPADRKQFVDALGLMGEEYRTKIYKGFSGNQTGVPGEKVATFFKSMLQLIDQSIAENKRTDKLYNAYNLVAYTDQQMEVNYLYQMLEGQVAVLSSGKLSTKEVLELLDTMRESQLYRADQESYILYPNKQLAGYLDINNIPQKDIDSIASFGKWIKEGDTRIISVDVTGKCHFNADFSNGNQLKAALEKMNVDKTEMQKILDVYEAMFNHKAFTGRSGTFYKYEGLGCIYWHMVSKLLLVIGENLKAAVLRNEPKENIVALMKHYHAVRKGIGAHKSPEAYGAFPFDPYSHTPAMAGVQQPGMTGQVKEDIISRFFELGVWVVKGQIWICPVILSKDEFVKPDATYQQPYLQFTYCNTLFVYLLDQKKGIDLIGTDGKKETISNYEMPAAQSQSLFNREGKIERVIVHLTNDLFIQV